MSPPPKTAPRRHYQHPIMDSQNISIVGNPVVGARGISMTVGNLGASSSADVKRMLAYSSIAQAGYMMVAFTAFPFDGIALLALHAPT